MWASFIKNLTSRNFYKLIHDIIQKYLIKMYLRVILYKSNLIINLLQYKDNMLKFKML